MSQNRQDKQLVERMKRGERRAFEEFVDSYGARLLRLVRRYIPNPTDAEDIMQEIFVDIYRSIGAFRGDSALSTYVYRIAVNHSLRHCQRNKLDTCPIQEGDEESDPDWQSAPEMVAVKQELASQVKGALEALPNLQRDIVILHELHGLTYQECASVLQVPIGTVKSRLSGAFRRLRVSLRSYVMGESGLCFSTVSETQQGVQGMIDVTEEVVK